MRGSILVKTNKSCTKYFRKTLNHHSTLSLFLKASLSNDCTRGEEDIYRFLKISPGALEEGLRWSDQPEKKKGK